MKISVKNVKKGTLGTNEQVRMQESFTGIDLFCGIGGFRIGMENNNIKCIFSSDIDTYAQKTYLENFGEVPYGDITKIKASDIPTFDILTAGFPCQPFSYAGRNEGFEDKNRGTLFYDICRILRAHKPKMFLLENVKGLKSHNGGSTLSIIESTLKKIGYKIKWQVLNSYHFGLPQYRERWYCVGFLEDIVFEFPKGNNTRPTLRNIIDINNKDPKLKLSKFETERIKHHFKNSTQTERVKHDNTKYRPDTKKGKHGVYSFQKPDGSLRFHVGDFAKTAIQEAFYSCLDTYSPTIIANRVPKLWDLQRKLSVKEAALLQGFPEDFCFPVSDAQAYKQLGNSVSIPVIDAIIQNMLYFYQLSNKSKPSTIKKV